MADRNCGKCGACLSVCPVYGVLLQEQASPRARIQLIKHFEQGDLSSTPFLKELVSRCLMCGSCAVNCPAGVDHYSKFMAMRGRMARDHGQKAAIKSLIWLLAGEYRLTLSARAAGLGLRLTPQVFQQKYGLGRLGLNRLPRFNARPFREACGEIIAPERHPAGTVLYFTGCGTNYLFGDTGLATLAILKHLGYRVIVPGNQTCCAIPMLFHGATEQAMGSIAENIRALDREDVSAVIVDCATCGTALKKEYPALFWSRGRDHAAADRISARVVHILSFIERHQGSLRYKDSNVRRIMATYHAPCHMKNHFMPIDELQALFRRLPHLEYIRARDADRCCGGGGTFFYEYPDLSRRILAEKVDQALATDADVWMTDCPVCRLQLSGRLPGGHTMQVRHPVKIIADGLLS